jgi:colicin import membrane protein|tara:strand:+ start:661 stop:1917 length:1257 start_codon:yes stop_codon:yes gene_type:complete
MVDVVNGVASTGEATTGREGDGESSTVTTGAPVQAKKPTTPNARGTQDRAATHNRRVAQVRARGAAMAEEERRRRQAKVKAKNDKIQEIAEKREREGAYASASGGVVDPEKSPIKKVFEQRRLFAGRVEAKGEAHAPAAKRPLWVAPTAKTPSEGSSSEEDEFHSAGETSDRDEGGQSSSGEESEDRRAVIRDVVAGVVTRVVASAVEAEKKVKMEAEKEAKMEAEKEAKMEAEKKAKMEAEKVKIETPPDAETAAAIRECVERAVAGVIAAGEALQAISTPPPAKRKVDPFATATTSTRGSGASSTRTPKQTVAGAKLTERLSEARAAAAEVHAEVAKSPLRAPFKERMSAGIKEPLAHRLKNVTIKFFKRVRHKIRRRAERIVEKNPTAVASGVLGGAILVLVARGSRDPPKPRKN